MGKQTTPVSALKKQFVTKRILKKQKKSVRKGAIGKAIAKRRKKRLSS